MAVLGMDGKYKQDQIIAAFPDMFGMSDAQIAEVPPFVRYFKCNDAIEKGDPGCLDNKYNDTICPTRSHKASWHPGNKYHALIGHMLAFTMLELADEALRNLVAIQEAHEGEAPMERQARLKGILQALNETEANEYANIFQQPLPDNLVQEFNNNLWWNDNKEANKEAMKDVLSFEMLVKGVLFVRLLSMSAKTFFFFWLVYVCK